MCGRARDYDHWDQAEGHTGDDDSKGLLDAPSKVMEAGTTRAEEPMKGKKRNKGKGKKKR